MLRLDGSRREAELSAKADFIPVATSRSYGTPHDSVPHEHALPPGHYVELTVEDTGVGIDRATQPQIFEPFFTTEKARQRTGLGLSTGYGIVKQSGGHVRPESELGQGAASKLLLPRALDSADRPRTPRREPALPRGSGSILLVEDEATVRTVTPPSAGRERLLGLRSGPP